jgi:glycosyltransferase A (GT-A) superfamily protein (DUF2064 family)
MNKQLLILFSKWPANGCSKTRIKEKIGEEFTEKLCFACLDDLIVKIQSLNNTDVVIVSDKIEDSVSFYKRYNVRALSLEEMNIALDKTRSEKFHKIFEYFLKEYRKAILIPMDVPHISTATIEIAFEKLEHFEHVYGPESNGGVYLIGINRLSEKTFAGVRWSTEYSYSDLIRNSKCCFALNMFFDLNNIQDLVLLNQSMLSTCPNLTIFIKSLLLTQEEATREVMTI